MPLSASSAATQEPVAEQLLIARINSADRMTLMTMDPRQPNRFEKKRNTSGRLCRTGGLWSLVLGHFNRERAHMNALLPEPLRERGGVPTPPAPARRRRGPPRAREEAAARQTAASALIVRATGSEPDRSPRPSLPRSRSAWPEPCLPPDPLPGATDRQASPYPTRQASGYPTEQ